MCLELLYTLLYILHCILCLSLWPKKKHNQNANGANVFRGRLTSNPFHTHHTIVIVVDPFNSASRDSPPCEWECHESFNIGEGGGRFRRRTPQIAFSTQPTKNHNKGMYIIVYRSQLTMNAHFPRFIILFRLFSTFAVDVVEEECGFGVFISAESGITYADYMHSVWTFCKAAVPAWVRRAQKGVCEIVPRIVTAFEHC